jgi:hypothetical protein
MGGIERAGVRAANSQDVPLRVSSPFVPIMMAMGFLFAMSGAYRSMVPNALASG